MAWNFEAVTSGTQWLQGAATEEVRVWGKGERAPGGPERSQVFFHLERAWHMRGTTESCPLKAPKQEPSACWARDHYIALLGRRKGVRLGMSKESHSPVGLSLPGLLATCSVQRGQQ